MSLETSLDAIRTKYSLPALAACAVIDGRPTDTVAVGVFASSAEPPRSPDRRLPARLRHQGHDRDPRRDAHRRLASCAGVTTLGELFDFVPAPWKAVTIADLIYQTSGLSEDLEPKGMSYDAVYRWKSTERAAWLKARLQDDLPGKREFVYSNASYAALGLACEKVTGKSWESLIQERLWKPLGIAGGGFGGPPKDLAAPPRTRKTGKLVPIDPKWNADNPAIMAPAGAVWLPLGEWAKFAAFHATGTPALLKPETLAKLHSTPPGSDYAGGWVVVRGQPWAGGDALTHTGSNTMNMPSPGSPRRSALRFWSPRTPPPPTLARPSTTPSSPLYKPTWLPAR